MIFVVLIKKKEGKREKKRERLGRIRRRKEI